jgi:hypothetical protein
MTKKILIFGFPHCGTSILKSIIGHVDNVEEIYNETKEINKDTDKEFLLCKWPFTNKVFFEKKYEDYIKIFIIRNPLFVFSSLNKRFNYKIKENHSIDEYINVITQFIKYRNNPHNNIYTIRYEDLFDNNYKELRILLDNLGLEYTDDIFDNSKYTNIHALGEKIESIKPDNSEHTKFRTWQINQPFVSNNDISKLDISESQKEKILGNKFILEVYPDINSIFDV